MIVGSWQDSFCEVFEAPLSAEEIEVRYLNDVRKDSQDLAQGMIEKMNTRAMYGWSWASSLMDRNLGYISENRH